MTAQRAPRVAARILVFGGDSETWKRARELAGAGHATEMSSGIEYAAGRVREGAVDAVLAGAEGASNLLELMREIGDAAKWPPIVVVGSLPVQVMSSLLAHGVLHCLPEQAPPERLNAAVLDGVDRARDGRLARPEARRGFTKAEAKQVLGTRFNSVLGGLWLANQPIVSTTTREPFAYETLLRNDDPMLGMPVLFFDVAEHLGRVFEASRTIRRLAAAQLAANPELVLFVNISPWDLSDEQLFDGRAELSAFANRVIFEVTERAALKTVRDVRKRADRLRAVGFRLAVDDLGSGYSGLSAVAELEPEFVKVDMSLVRNIDSSPTARSLVAAIYAFGRQSGTKVIAEGVETPAERDALLDLGADLLQGYLFARPAAGFPSLSPTCWDGIPAAPLAAQTEASRPAHAAPSPTARRAAS